MEIFAVYRKVTFSFYLWINDLSAVSQKTSFSQISVFTFSAQCIQLNQEIAYMSHFASACKTEGQNGISRLISKLLRTLDSSLRDHLFVLQNEVF